MEGLGSLSPNLQDGTVYAAFKEQIYAIYHDNLYVRLHILNETTLCWELFLQQELQMKTGYLGTCTSFDEMAIILESCSDNLDHIYKFDPESKTFTFFKTTYVKDTYLFVPDHIYQ